MSIAGYLTMDQACARMATTRDYLHRLRQLGVLQPVARVDKTLLYRERDVITYVLRHGRLGRIRAARGTAGSGVSWRNDSHGLLLHQPAELSCSGRRTPGP
jgi:hypothetical protein